MTVWGKLAVLGVLLACGALVVNGRTLEQAAGSSEEKCQDRVTNPRVPLTIAPVQFIFNLLKVEVPSSCGSFELSGFQACAKDIGLQEGCCSATCTSFLSEINGKCWDDIQTQVCNGNDEQLATMLDLLMRHCDEDQRGVQCTQDCDTLVVRSRKKVTMNATKFSFSLGAIQNPKKCTGFNIRDLLGCGDMIGVEEGCCSPDCSAVFLKITDGCWEGLQSAMCKSESDQPRVILDLLARRCDSTGRSITCSDTPDAVEARTPRTTGRAALARPQKEQLLQAARKGDLLRVQVILMGGTDVDVADASDNSVLDWAAFGGHVEIIQTLIAQGADVNSRDSSGRTPLMEASWGGHLESVEVLIAEGSDIDAQSVDGSTALIYAASEGHAEVASSLIDAGAELDIENKVGVTALIAAAFKGHEAVVQVLVNAGAATQVKDNEWDQTALMWAAERGHAAVVEVLITAGASTRIASRDGDTAETLAEEQGHTDIVELIRAANG